jgi:hypothetical protein
MKRRHSYAIFVTGILLSLIQQGSGQQPARTRDYVAIASIDGGPKGVKPGVVIGLALERAGIPCVIAGSSRIDVEVPADRQVEAMKFLKSDAELQKYEITVAHGAEASVRPVPVTIVGLQATPYEIPWYGQLTLGRVVLMNGGLSFPGSPSKAEIRRVLTDGTESKTIYDLRRLFTQTPIDDPKLQAGDRVTFLQPKPIKF